MVAGKHHSRCPAYGNPACSLKGLRRLVYEERIEFLPFQQTVGSTYECACYHTRLAKQLLRDAHLQFCGT